MSAQFIDVSPELILDLCKHRDRPFTVVTKDAIPDDAAITGCEVVNLAIRIHYDSASGDDGQKAPTFRVTTKENE